MKGIVIGLLFVFQSVAWSTTETVVTIPQNGSLENGLQKALEEAKIRFPNHAFWVGYGIEVMLPEHDTVMGAQHVNIQGTINSGRKGPTLGELITGEPEPRIFVGDNKTVQNRAKQALADLNAAPQKLYPQQVAILFRMPAGAASLNTASDICYSSYSIHFDLESLPLIWVGDGDAQQSLALLEKLYGAEHSRNFKPVLVSAIGMHRPLPEANAFLKSVLASHDSEDVRATAIEALSYVRDAGALNALVQTAKSDPSMEMRTTAIEQLAEWNDPKALAVVREIAETPSTEELQQVAMQALSESNDGLSSVIEIAKHGKNAQTRRMAIEILGDSDDTRARKALIEILEGT